MQYLDTIMPLQQCCLQVNYMRSINDVYGEYAGLTQNLKMMFIISQ